MIRIEPAGAEALLLTLAEEPEVDLSVRLAELARRLREGLGEGVRDLVPGWTTLMLHYDPYRIASQILEERLGPLLAEWHAWRPAEDAGRLHEIPVWYAGEDLATVAVACGLTGEGVIELHSAAEYRVGAIGFAPGFAYLGGLDPRLVLPRRATAGACTGRQPGHCRGADGDLSAGLARRLAPAGTQSVASLRSGRHSSVPTGAGRPGALRRHRARGFPRPGRARMNGLRVVKAGPQSLLQDDGRRGWQHLGVSPGGPLDRQAAAWANRLLGNPWGAPLLEIAFGGLVLECTVEATWLALTGARLALTVDGRECLPWSRFRVRRGQRIELGFAEAGQRAYLACAGGFRAKPVLGSIACQVRDGLGGLRGDGRILAEGDCLPCVEAGAACPWDASVPWRFQPDYRQQRPLRVLLGGDAAAFDAASRRAFFASAWRISPRSDRMGVRLAGEPLRAHRAPGRRVWWRGQSRFLPMANPSC